MSHSPRNGVRYGAGAVAEHYKDVRRSDPEGFGIERSKLKHEKKESKNKEKKEHMARKGFVSGKGDKKAVLEGLSQMAKNEKLEKYSSVGHGEVKRG
jgi:hypothetical protein